MDIHDRERIRERMAIYANAIDSKDYEGIAGCFTADAAVTYAGYAEALRGADAIIAHMRRALEPLDAMQHIFGNLVIVLAGDTAKLTCDILAQHIRHGVPGGESYLVGGKYEVALRLADGEWRFEALSARTLWGTGNRELLPKM